MNSISNKRNDISQTFEDFARIMEDYFGVIPPEVEQFDLDKMEKWEYDDIDNTMTFYFDDEFNLDELAYFIEESHAIHKMYEYNEYEHLNRQNLTITIVGKTGGLK